MRISKIVAGIYALLCVLSLALMAVGTFGWFGQERDPLSAVFAVIMAMPWPMAINSFVSADILEGPVMGLAVILAGMALNLVIIRSIGKYISRKSGAAASDQHSN